MTAQAPTGNTITVAVIAITGDTYPARKAIKSAVGGPRYARFEKEPEPTWYVPANKAEAIAPIIKEFGLTTEETTLNYDPFRELDREELREKRSVTRNRKADQLEERAARKREQAAELQQQINSGSGGNDYAFWTQPAMRHNARVRSFEKQRQRLRDKMDKAHGLLKEAEELESRAESLRETPAVKGDAEIGYQAHREEQDKVITVGSPVMRPGWAVDKGYVIRVNRKTYTIEWQGGGTYAVDKTMVQLDPDRPKREERPVFPFKKGDIIAAEYYGDRRKVGQITRVNRNTVSYRFYWRDDWDSAKAPRTHIEEATEEERTAFMAQLAENNPNKPVCWLEKMQRAVENSEYLKFRGKRLDTWNMSMVTQVCANLSEEHRKAFIEKTGNNPLKMIEMAQKIYARLRQKQG